MIENVVLYRAPTTEANADAIADWLRDRLAAVAGTAGVSPDPEVVVRDRLLDPDGPYVEDPEALAETFAAARVQGAHTRETGNTMLGTIRYEERALASPERAGGVVYDGDAILPALNELLPATERELSVAHVPLLDRVLATWGDHDGRWHKRVAVLGQPSPVSVPGLYEAPAKPEAYYKAKQSHALLSGGAPPREVLESEIDGEFLVADDPRTTEALKGYVLSAAHYLATGEAFCETPGCRLSNPHRQPGVVEAQLREPAFCPEHAALYADPQDR